MLRPDFSFRRKSSDKGHQQTLRQNRPRSSSPNLPSDESDSPLQESNVAPASSSSLFSRVRISTSPFTRSKSDGFRRGRDSDTISGKFGLSTVYTPTDGHKVDIVFIHGLGGTSRFTWSKNEDPALFWPLKFLPLEPSVSSARISTFGYNANFLKAGNIDTTVLDFAKTLLSELKNATDEQKGEMNFGDVPLIFVVHSMGGLIVKEAYMQGQIDPEYKAIIEAISAITFLATPHRGTNLAETLNWILQSSIIGNAKPYIAELGANSITLQRLNEQFRHFASRLDLFSFYETQPTPIGKAFRVMLLKKESSVLGYPGEISQPLNADHHNVCKYDGPSDPNYISVSNVLRKLVSNIIKGQKPPVISRRESHDVKMMLAISQLPDTDYIFFRDQWTQGTCDWILKENNFLKWKTLSDSDLTSRLLWLKGGGGTGKSILSSFIINELVEQNLCCQYFFFRYADQKKRTLSLLLRSLAYQIARALPSFLQEVLQLVDQTTDFATVGHLTIWDRIFKSLLFRSREMRPLYWIIDGLDEADDPRAVIKLLSEVSQSSVPIRILVLGRNTSEISTTFQQASKVLSLQSMEIEGHLEDMREFIRQEFSMPGEVDYTENIKDRLIEGAKNNFLWVRLATDKLRLCHNQDDIERALRELPTGMGSFYDRMGSSIACDVSPEHKTLALAILQCVTCSLRLLKMPELAQALGDHLSGNLDLQRSILDLCGGFVVIDNGGNVAMIHQTAREYLIGDRSYDPSNHLFHVDYEQAHKHLFLSCIRCLMSTGLRAKLIGRQWPALLDYAASSWAAHLASTPPGDRQISEELNTFLKGQRVLTWIQALAASEQLRGLIQASKFLSMYAAKQDKHYSKLGEKDHIVLKKQELIRSWAIDLVKIVGKFGRALRQKPDSIYKQIPPFCPQNSSIYQLFGRNEPRKFMVSGLSAQNWDDSLARIPLGSGYYTSAISSAGTQIAILALSEPLGAIFFYDASDFEETGASPIIHGERVHRMQLNNTGTIIASYGYHTTKIWDVKTGKCNFCVENIESKPIPLTMLLTKNDTKLLVGTGDRCLRSLDLTQTLPKWHLVAELEEEELKGHFLNAASHMALNENGSLIAVAYRGYPLSAWEVDGPEHISHCPRAREELTRGEVMEALWHPHSEEVLGLYLSGVVFKWRPYDHEVDEVATGASRLAISKDGILFITGDVRGTVKVYDRSTFTVLYQLVSEDSVIGLSFSPDSCRFYDIRGYYGNAWEPNALVKLSEQRVDNGTDYRSQDSASSTPISSFPRIHSVTEIASCPVGRLYCVGTENGSVSLHDTQRGRLTELYMSKSFFSIEHMAWSDDGEYFCFSESSRIIRIMTVIQVEGQSYPVVEKKAEISLRNHATGAIHQFLFHPDSSQLLVYSASTLHVISLANFSVAHSVDIDILQCIWIIHPQVRGLIVGCSPSTFDILDWELTSRHTHNFDYTAYRTTAPPPEWKNAANHQKVDRVLVTSDKRHLLLQTSLSGEKEKTLLYFETSRLWTSPEETGMDDQETHSPTLHPVILPRDISSQVAFSLAILSRDCLIFLSKTFTISSWPLPSGLTVPPVSRAQAPRPVSTGTITSRSTVSGNVDEDEGADSLVESMARPIFSLPGDWISRGRLALCSIWSVERSFLCPRNGEVAVVRSSNFT